jgi:cytochrome P450
MLAGELLDPGAPVGFEPNWDAWMVYHHAQIRDVLRPEVSRVDVSGWARPENPSFAAPGALDGPQWRRLRSAIEPHYRADRVKELVPQLASAAHGCLRDALDQMRGRVELMRGFAQPYAVVAAGVSLDVQPDPARLAGWLRETQRAQAAGTFDVPAEGVEFFRSIAATGNPFPGLTEWENVAILWTHLIDSADTLSSQLGTLVLGLVRSGLLERVRADRSLVANAVEAALWWSPAFPYVRRRLRQEVSLGGVCVPEGADVMCWLSAANRSIQSTVDVTFANRARHVSFGYAPRVCVGAALARQALAAGLGAVLDLMPAPVRLAGPPRYRLILNNSLKFLQLEYGGKRYDDDLGSNGIHREAR